MSIPGDDQQGPRETDEPVREWAGAAPDGIDHHGRDEGRDTLTAGESQRAMGDAPVQDQPAMSQNNASDDEKISGILAQTRVDVGDQSERRIVEVLRQRLDQAGVPVTDEELPQLARRVRTGEI